MSFIENNSLLNTLDRSVGQLLQLRSNDESDLLKIAGSFTSYALRQGHVCLDLNDLNTTELGRNLDPESLLDFKERLSKSDLVGSKTKNTFPLILSEYGKLYFHRYWHYEQRLLQAIDHRLNSDEFSQTSRDKHFIESLEQIGEDQKRAVDRAGQSKLTLISGGPGTGKTTAVLYILAHLIDRHCDDSLKIALTAPTGKAAQRIKDALTSGKEILGVSDEVKNLIPADAVTLHRLLGYKRNSPQFQHNQENPLPYDVVVVDEASMLDLLMFSKLLDALNPETRLILLGDSHQLASVEAGSIFGDLVEASRTNKLLERHTVELNQNYRFGVDSSLYQACKYVKDGNGEAAVETINAAENEISFKSLPNPSKLYSELERSLAPHFLKLTQTIEPDIVLSLMEEVCILSPIRKGSFGVEGLNASMESIIRNLNPSLTRGIYFSGQPILITENSYSQSLFNGDQGIILSSEDEPGQLFAYFRVTGDNEIRRFPISALPKFESAYAFTVHKSQGSEYRRVVFILPPAESPILSRELVYTAISRSREFVEIWGQVETFKLAVQKRTLRTSGILDFLS